ncbi:hypothetical protein ABEW34_21425 [Paenibacillus algorifonticola]|uniref:hypothetical protein n=1 Tax=Paenibacillus algorifonticola TaxID=684063 RepID=UPI003D282EC6
MSALRFTDEVHDFILKLSASRKLSEWMARHAEQDLRENNGSDKYSNNEIMLELREIKQLLHGSNHSLQQRQGSPKQELVIEQISSFKVQELIPEEDLEYAF